MKLLLLIAVLAVLTMATPVDSRKDEDYLWDHFKIKYNRKYTPEEEPRRRAIFEAACAQVRAHNIRYDIGKESYTMKINQLADKTPEEIRQGFIKFHRVLENRYLLPFIQELTDGFQDYEKFMCLFT